MNALVINEPNPQSRDRGEVHAIPNHAGDIELQGRDGNIIVTIPKAKRDAVAEFIKLTQ